MHLTRHTDYALRLLMLLAAEPDKLHTIEEAARRYGVSRNHLMKVAQTLTQAGFVKGIRGRAGGLKLALPPEEINLGKVVRATEENFNIVECFDMEVNTCPIARNCGLKTPLREAATAFLNVLDGYALSDLAAKPGAAQTIRRLAV
ncbi:Rrf2 family transcriptional regulator [Tepidicaulis sp. LMO-SS28]|uniref:Rrf2 family transcriptional regulator n=1 Tax=Tepidicaulis sp. LMO-SS28 TaxID=3447455 RepID=UPI003EDF6CDC